MNMEFLLRLLKLDFGFFQSGFFLRCQRTLKSNIGRLSIIQRLLYPYLSNAEVVQMLQ